MTGVTELRRYGTRHATDRARERLDVDLTNDDWKVVCGLILLGRSEFKAKQGGDLEAHRVEYRGLAMVVVIDRKRPCIVTVLPKRAADPGYVFLDQDQYKRNQLSAMYQRWPHLRRRRRA